MHLNTKISYIFTSIRVLSPCFHLFIRNAYRLVLNSAVRILTSDPLDLSMIKRKYYLLFIGPYIVVITEE